MKTLIAFGIVGTLAVVSCIAADSYSVEATITLHKKTKQYEATGRVCKLTDRGAEQVEEVITRPRVISTVGSPGSFYVGVEPSNPNYQNQENVTMDVNWPKEGEGSFAVCTIIVKRGDKVASKSKLRVTVNER